MKVIVIGGGAAGFFAAINAAELNPKAKVFLLEKSNKLLQKVLVSGGGRCNVTHAYFENNLLIKNYPRGEKELRSAFAKFTTNDTVDWFKRRGITLKTEADGRMFPVTDNSETIVHCLLNAAEKLNVEIKLQVSVKEIIPDKKGFILKTDKEDLLCDKLIIATGGNPKAESYNWLKKLGHTIIPPVPSLFTFNINDKELHKLMGLSVLNAKVKVVNTKLQTEGPLLITHWGLSGPAILKSSAWGARLLNDMNYDFKIQVDWLNKYKEDELREELLFQKEKLAPKLAINTNPFELPRRLWEYFLQKTEIYDNTRWADVSKKQINTLLGVLIRDEYTVKGKTTFKEEFVTCGGVSLKEIDFATMQSTIVPNLYFAGEVLDIDGITGGFNFQSAWTTGWIAAKSIVC
ncbi:MAG TPA: NAD(P)/FAD-dependent oxidoreductase [Bacteroidia bacterium]|jgi:predicted Rossmann fold flavoprotein|nr:NAD(P)/FAD-dependent oxidoreductase [Bacteroidia bacterium]